MAADGATSATLQPPASGLLDVPSFDRKQFSSSRPGKSTAAGIGSRATTRAAAGAGAARNQAEQPAGRRAPQAPFDDEITAAQYLPEEEPAPRVASRSPRATGDDGAVRRGAG